jgi:hypothetical protein
MPAFPVAEAQLVALFMEAVTYGMYTVTLAICVRALFWDRQGLKHNINWPMVAVTVLMAAFSTLDVALGLKHNLEAFIFYAGPGGAAAEFDDISYWVNVMKVRLHFLSLFRASMSHTSTVQTVDTQVMSLIGDAMLVCFMVARTACDSI